MLKNKYLLAIFSVLTISFVLVGSGIVFACEGGGTWAMFQHNWHRSGFATCDIPETAQLMWEYDVGVDFSAPIYDTDIEHTYGTLFVASNDGYIYAFDDITRDLLWAQYLGIGTKSTPLLDNSTGHLYVGSGNKLYALNKLDGNILWSYTTGGDVESSPATIPGSGMVYFGSGDGNVYALSSSGTLEWSFTTGGAVISSPVIHESGMVFVGSSDRKLYALNSSTGAPLWDFETNGDIISTPMVRENIETVFVGSLDGQLYALNRNNGNLLWNYTTGDVVISSPAVNRNTGVLYIGSNDNKVYAFNSTTGDLLWSYITADDVKSSPAISDGKVIVNSVDGHVYVLSESTGSLIWDYETGYTSESSPMVENDRLFVGTNTSVFVFGHVDNVTDITIDIDPDTINKKSKGKWITAYIEVDGYDPSWLDTSSLLLEGTVPSSGPTNIGDHDGDGIKDLMVKFDRKEVIGILDTGEAVEITITGMVGETPFEGSDIVNVIG